MYEPIWGQEFIETYMHFADQWSKNNYLMNMSTLLVVVGQALRDVVFPRRGALEDCRIHSFIVQDSGTGKAGGMMFPRKIASDAGFNFGFSGEATTAGLVGTVSQDGPNEGVLARYDVLVWTEAQMLLKQSDTTHSSSIMEVMNSVMDTDALVHKDLAYGTINYHTGVSVMCTTYPPPEGKLHNLITIGFLPRCVVVYDRKSTSYYWEIAKWITENVGKYYSHDRYSTENLSETLRVIAEKTYRRRSTCEFSRREWRKRKHEYFSFKADFDPLLQILVEEWEKCDEQTKMLARPFITRAANMMVKIVCAMAALDEVSPVVKDDHVEMATQFVRPLWMSTLNMVRDARAVVGDKSIFVVESAINELVREVGPRFSYTTLLRKTRISSHALKTALNTLREMGFVRIDEKKTKGRRKLIIEVIGYGGIDNE